MSRFIPDAATLLQAAGDYLEAELLPALTGYHRFQTRVALNALRIVTRELHLAPEQHAAQQVRLVALLGHDGAPQQLEAELAQAIADGHHPLDDPALIAHLRATLRESLAIDHPNWAADPGPRPDPQGASTP